MPPGFMARVNGTKWLISLGTAVFLLWAGWLSTAIIQIQANRFTAQDGLDLTREFARHERLSSHAVMNERVNAILRDLEHIKEQQDQIERELKELLK